MIDRKRAQRLCGSRQRGPRCTGRDRRRHRRVALYDGDEIGHSSDVDLGGTKKIAEDRFVFAI